MAAEALASSNYDYLLKIILIGDSSVGKSCLLRQFLSNSYDQMYSSTIGVDFEMKQVIMNGKTTVLQIWDTAGQERFRTITTSYYRVSDVVLLVFDVTARQSFEHVSSWLHDVREYTSEHVSVLLVGNKVDLPSHRAVTFEEAKAFADEHFIPYMETSARTGLNVESAFTAISLTALSHKIAWRERRDQNAGKGQGSISLNSANSFRTSCC